MVVTVETVSSVGDVSDPVEALLHRTAAGWEVSHTSEAFEVEVFDLTGRIVHRSEGMPGDPVVLEPGDLPQVALVHWHGVQSGLHKTWRVAR